MHHLGQVHLERIGSAKLFQGLYILDQTFLQIYPFVLLLIIKHPYGINSWAIPLLIAYSLQNLLHLKSSTVNKVSHCTMCPLAKQRKLSFTSNNHLSSNAFDLIHVHIWGPFSTQTHAGYPYFLTIVDDATHYTWIFMLKHMSDVVFIVPQFFKLIETQRGKTIKQMRSDNAPELKFTEFFEQKRSGTSILMCRCAQQNSAVERKHQHILNTARVQYFQSQVPLTFWGECILTAIYLINRTPSMLLQWEFPFQKLNNTVPDYISLRIFGSLCYASSLSHNRSKFIPELFPLSSSAIPMA